MATDKLSLGKLNRQLIYLAIAIAAGFVLFYLYHAFSSQQSVRQGPQIPNLIATDAHIIQYNKAGTMAYQFYSDKSLHYKKQNKTDFVKPIGYCYSEKHKPWKVTADKGQAINGDQVVHLFGNVHLHQESGPTNKETTLITSTVSIYPQKNIAENNVLTNAEQPGISVSSIGFRANFKQGKVILLSQTQGNYINH